MSDTTGPAPAIPDEAWQAAAAVFTARGVGFNDVARDAVRAASAAALAGRTVVELPEPSSVDEDGDMRWATPTGQAVAYLDYDRGHDLGMVHVSGRFHASPDEAERHALAILAAAREARRLAADSSGDGEQDG